MKFKITLIIALMLLSGSNLLNAQKIGFPDELITKAEKTLYEETSLSDEVSTFIHFLTENCSFARLEQIGTTKEGRPLEIVIMADPMVTNAHEAKATGKPIIYIQGNIHAGEVEGKETVIPYTEASGQDAYRRSVNNQWQNYNRIL